MQLREYARGVVLAETIAGKLEAPPADLADDDRGAAERISAPERPVELEIGDARSVKVPPVAGMADVAQRVRILHALANHELQAAELFGWAILAFPDAPAALRRGLCAILVEEQLHCRLYIERLEACGGRFGALPVTGHFWNKLAPITGPLEFLCTMGLTFENANLDFAQDYARAARAAGDEATCAVLERVHEDEIRHVAFAWRWLQRLKRDDEDGLDAYQRCVAWPLGTARARGKSFDRAARVAAGLDERFIAELERTGPVRPNGRPR